MTARILPGNEAIVQAIVAKLQAGLPDVVDALNADPQAPVVLDQVDVDSVCDYVPVREELRAFPTFAVQEAEGSITDDVGWGATGNHGFVVAIFDAHASQQDLARRLRRYRRAAASVLWDDRRIGDSITGAWGINDMRYEAGPTLGRRQDPQQWLSFTSIGFLCLSEEDGV